MAQSSVPIEFNKRKLANLQASRQKLRGVCGACIILLLAAMCWQLKPIMNCLLWCMGDGMFFELSQLKATQCAEDLNITLNASDAEINRAFTRLSLLCHPDKTAAQPKNERDELTQVFDNLESCRTFLTAKHVPHFNGNYTDWRIRFDQYDQRRRLRHAEHLVWLEENHESLLEDGFSAKELAEMKRNRKMGERRHETCSAPDWQPSLVVSALVVVILYVCRKLSSLAKNIVVSQQELLTAHELATTKQADDEAKVKTSLMVKQKQKRVKTSPMLKQNDNNLI